MAFSRHLRHQLLLLSFVLTDQVGQIVGNGHVQLVDRTTPEVRACIGQPLELVHGVQPEEVSVHVRIGQVVSRYVGQRAQALVDVIVLWVLYDVVADGLPVCEERLVVVVRGQITVDHLGVVSYPHLQHTPSCRVMYLCVGILLFIKLTTVAVYNNNNRYVIVYNK